MSGVMIIDAVRTAIGKIGGTLRDVEVDYLAAKVIEEILTRAGIEGQKLMR